MRLAAGAVGLLLVTLFFNWRYLAVAPTLLEEEHFRAGEHLHATGEIGRASCRERVSPRV